MPPRTLEHDEAEPSGPADASAPTAEQTFVVFLVDDVHYAVPVTRVQRTLPMPHLTRLPASDPAILGAFQHAGRIITTWDTRRWFQAGNDPPEEPWLLIIDHHGTPRAILVDRVVDVLGLPGGTIRRTKGTPRGVPAEAILGRLTAPAIPDDQPLKPDEPEPSGLDHERAERRARRLAAATLLGIGTVHVLDVDALLPEVTE